MAKIGGGVAGLLLASATVTGAAEEAAPRGRAHTIAGELTRVDIRRGAVVVTVPATREAEARDYEAAVAPATRLLALGRVVALADLRPGERVLVVCQDESPGRHRAREVRVLASPSPRPRGASAP